jgi:phage baseplate assembly protein W
MGETFINIQFPFSDDTKGKFLEMNKTTKKAIKADLMHLLMTNRGERLYLPDFGTNLRKYIFEQNDFETHTGIKSEIQSSIDKYIPNLKITELKVERSDSNEHLAVVRVDYNVSDDAFSSSDFVIIEL